VAYGHFEIEDKVSPNKKDRKAYPPVKYVYLVRRSALYNTPVPLSNLSIKGIRWGKKISESQFQTLQDLAGGSKQYSNGPLSCPGTQEAADLAEPSPERVATTTYRILRDTELARQVKLLHEFKCQVCERTIELPDGSRYAEAHHIQPLGQPHNGPDVIGNILCLCPNHHAEFDLGVSAITLSALRCCDGYAISQKYVDYHNQNIHKGAIPFCRVMLAVESVMFEVKKRVAEDIDGCLRYPYRVCRGTGIEWLKAQGGAGHGRMPRGGTEFAAGEIGGRNGGPISTRAERSPARLEGAFEA
jgi:hypothetical protein